MNDEPATGHATPHHMRVAWRAQAFRDGSENATHRQSCDLYSCTVHTCVPFEWARIPLMECGPARYRGTLRHHSNGHFKVLTPDRFAMQLVGSRAAGPDDIAVLRAAVLEVLGSKVRFDIEQVADIARDRSGKLHFCRSLVA